MANPVSSLLATAKELHSFGINPIPCINKFPEKLAWRQYEDRLMSMVELESLFHRGAAYPQIGVICGTGSDGLQFIDFDKKNYKPEQNVYEEWADIIRNQDEKLFNRLVIELTQGGGFHVYFRCEDIEGNEVLASWFDQKASDAWQADPENNKPDPLTGIIPVYNKKLFIRNPIETRGQGGLGICDPSPGYALIQNDLFSLPEITPYQRQLLLSASRSFNDMPEEKEQAIIKKRNDSFKWQGINPFDDYNERANPIELLQKHGWTIAESNSKERIYLLRPGNTDQKHSANYHIAKKRLRVFSTSTIFDTDPHNKKKDQKGLAYDPAGIYAVLEHGGDRKKAFSALLDAGYGSRSTKSPDVAIEDPDMDEPENGEEEKKPIIFYVERFLKQRYEFARNVVTSTTEFKPKGSKHFEPVSPDDLFRELQHAKISYKLDHVKSLLKSKFIPKYDPFKEYFESLPKTSGDSEIRKLAGYLTMKVHDDMPVGFDIQEHWIAMYRKFLVRSVACGIDGFVNRYVMTLIMDKQNTGKSTFIRFHNPFGERKYLCESPIRDGKDTQFKFAESFIYNLEELASLNKHDVDKLKAIISAFMIRERKPYAINDEEYPRRCSFWGSTNKTEFLTDSENTRWLCFVIQSINWAYKKEVDIHKVWAEAYWLYKEHGLDAAENTKEENINNELLNRNFQVSFNEHNMLVKHFEKSSSGDKPTGAEFLTATDICVRIKDVEKNLAHLNTNTMGKALSFHKFLKTKYRGYYGYWVKEIFDTEAPAKLPDNIVEKINPPKINPLDDTSEKLDY